MPELRQNFFTKEWAIIATERAKRPEELATHRAAPPVASFVETCPFCPGNESMTPPEVLRSPANVSEPWTVRVIPNKFAALSSDVQPTRNLQHLRRGIDGFGFHEVIIDSSDHARCMALLADEHVASILRVYRERYNTLSIDRRVNHITIFKNNGGRRGREPAASALATDCNAGNPQPGAPPVARGTAPLRRCWRVCVLLHGGTGGRRSNARCAERRALRGHGGIRLAHTLRHAHLSPTAHGQL